MPLAWASTEEAALASAYERFRFGPTGWKVQSELPNVLNFEAATAFVRPDDLRGGFVLGPDVGRTSRPCASSPTPTTTGSR